MNIKAKRIVAVCVAAMALSTTVLPALADPGDPYSVNAVNQENKDNAALINPAATVQLDIHKFLGMPTGGVANGTEQTIMGRPALQGVNFDVFKVVGIDLTTNKGWEDAAAIREQNAATLIADGKVTVNGTTYTVAKDSPVTTDAKGTAVFTKPNGVGLYLVSENLGTSGTITNLDTKQEVAKNTITPSKPFLVTLPMTNPADTKRWMYDVNVYPKNQSDYITKKVQDGNVGTSNQDGYFKGQKLTYVLNSSVNVTDGNKDGVINGADLARYEIMDQLDKSVKFVSANLSIAGTALVKDTDYTLKTDANNLVTITFTPAGLDKLAANKGSEVVTNIVVEIVDAPTGDIPNTAGIIPNNDWKPGSDGVPYIPSNKVVSKYGNVVINKYDPADKTADMSGTEFAIYRDANFDGTCDSSEVKAGTEFMKAVVGAGNKATFSTLEASNWYNNEAQTVNHGYCVVETQAKTGYNLDATPKYVMIDYKQIDAKATDQYLNFTVDVANEKSNLGNSLPLTGGAGVALLSGLGVVLVGGGVAYYIVSSRRKDESGA